MDFYDSIFQYDLEIENKITKRLNKFLRFINILKNENQLNITNTGDMKYTHITNILDEIKTSTKFKNRLFINKKKNLLLRMSNKTKVNSKYYIYAKNMSQNNHKMDIIEVKNNLLKKDDSLDSIIAQKEKEVKFCEIFNQKIIFSYNKHPLELKEKEELEILKSDTNKIVCDMIKQNIKNIYKRKLNEIILKNQNMNINNTNSNNIDKDKDKEKSEISLNKSKDVKNNNYIKIDLSKEKERKINNNHSSEKNKFMKYLLDSKKNPMNNKDLINSVSNNNGNNLKIKVCNDMILNFNNINNGNNLNNLLIVNKKIKSVKNDNYNHNMKIKKRNKENEEKKDIMDYTHKKNISPNNKDNNLNISKNSEIEDENEIKIADQSHKKLAVRNIQRIHIKNVKLKNNQTGYNLTNFRKKQISDLDNININSNDKNFTKKNKKKNINFASPSDFIIDGKKLNILKFKLGKNFISPNRKITEKSIKRNKDLDNSNEKENSIISLFDNKTRDNFSNGVKFNSVRKKKMSDEMSCNELSQILGTKKLNENNNNFPIRNYKTNFNVNNININNINNINNANDININNNPDNNDNIYPFRKESEAENYQVKKSLSKEAGSQSQFPWRFSNSNTNTIMNKSNNKGNVGKNYLNQILKAENKGDGNNGNIKNNLKNDKKLATNKNNNIYKDIAIKNKKGLNYQYIYEQKQEKSAKNRKLRNNFRKNEVYHDTIDNKGEPSSYRGVKIKGKKRILSTRVHIRGIKSSKNFNDIL